VNDLLVVVGVLVYEIPDIIGIGGFSWYPEVIASLTVCMGYQPRADGVVAIPSEPTKEVDPKKAPIKKMGGDFAVPVRLVDLSPGSGDDNLHLFWRHILGSIDSDMVLLRRAILLPKLVHLDLSQSLDDNSFLHPSTLNDNSDMIDLGPFLAE
jgi:hypothetical protein